MTQHSNKQPSNTQPPAMSFKQILLIFLRGFAMGAADLVPGVSGGTIAFITGIYSRLINALTQIDMELVALALKFRIKDCWRKVDANFLCVLFLGIFSAIISLAHLVSYLLEYHPVLVWSFFVGLVMASLWLLRREWCFNVSAVVAFLIGMLLVLATAFLPSMHAEPTLFAVFLGGSIAICAMLLPGVSGSFLLLLFGLYEPAVTAIKEVNIPYILSFAGGAAMGFIGFSRLIHWLLRRFYNTTLMFLSGLLAGSVWLLWPWKKMAEDGVRQLNIMPSEYATLFGEPQVLASIGCFMFALLFIIIMDYVAQRFSTSNPESNIAPVSAANTKQ